MADVIAKLQVDSSQFDQKLKSAVEQMTKMEAEVRRTGATFAYADKEELEFIKSLGSMETSSTSAKTKMMEYTNAIASLTATYRAMTDEEKQSPFGKAMSASIDQLKVKAAELKDVMSDTNIEIKAMASDTSTFDALSQGFTSIVSVIQVGMGAMQAFGVKNEEAMEAMARLQGVMAVTSGVIKIQNALQKQSAMMVGVATIQKKAAAAAEAIDTAAKGKNIAVTTAATVAQKALNAVASANPYVLLATAIASVTAAVVGFTMAAKNAEEASGGLSNAQKAQAQSQQEAQKSIAQVTGLYNRLKIEWQSLTTEQEKNNWIEENKSSFESLGISIRNVVDADRAFVTMSDKVVAALRSRAKANALQELYETKTREAIEASLKVAKFIQPAAKNAGDTIRYNPQDWQSMGLSMEEGDVTSKTSFQPYIGSVTEHKLTEQGAAKVNAYYAKKAEEDAARISKQYIEEVDKIYGGMMVSAIQEASVNESALGKLGLGKTNKPTTETPKDLGPLQEAQRKISELTNEALTADEERREAIRLEIEGLQKQVEEYKKIQDYVQGIKKDEDKPAKETKPKEEKLLNYSQEGIANLGSQIKSTMSKSEIGSEGYLLAADQLLDFTTFENLLKAATERGVQPDPEWMASLFEDIKIGADVAPETWQAVVDSINEMIEGTEFPPIKLDVKTGGIEAAEKDMNKLSENVQGAIGAFGQLGGAIQQIDDPAAQVAGIIMQAVANVAASFAKSLLGAVGPWDWIAAAIGGVSTMISTIAAIKSATSGGFANGGIVPGNSFSGDNLRTSDYGINSGELILNRAQQGSIAGQLQGNPMGNLRLSTEISGTNLRVVLNNDNRSKGGDRNFYSKIH